MTQPISFRPLHGPGSVRRTGAETVPAAPSSGQQSASVPLARLTGLARALANEGPPVDHARIAQIRQAIASGSYRPDANAVADAMLRHFGWSSA
ncbi:flagellar biosynthesis anti-sigma factor FlgM [Sphingorhabdus buctiana]|jgi:negative regulator of flagellin synthesis FlgM|uniref:Negative regulator of flagellin synthesis n=1 Tax=Sphingorhabdus buctiana TaxID=1508805 RepID=A0ABW4MF48_9SPHN